MTQRRKQVIKFPTKQFNALPEEIKFLIFMAMDVRTLTRSRSVCRSWKISIDSPSLKYKIELAVSGVIEGPPRTHEIGKRTDLLKGHRAAWRNLVWHELASIPAAPHTIPDGWSDVLLHDNILAQTRADDPRVYLTRIPSRRLAAAKWESWTVPSLLCEHFTMDPSQDLLVLMQTTEDCGLTIHLRSLTTGAAHPLARNSTFDLYLAPYNAEYDAQVVQDHLGILVHEHLEPEELPLVVWNWKTGDKILEIVSHSFYALTFLDEFHILVASYGFKVDEAFCISVYDLTSPAPAQVYADEATRRCAFMLPGDDWLFMVYVRCRPTSARPSVSSYAHPEDLPDTVVVVSAFCNAEDAFEVRDALKITAPASRLRRLVAGAAPGQRFAWHEWGLTDTHAQVDTSTVRDSEYRSLAACRFDYIAGMRAVKFSEDLSRLCVYNFSPLRVPRYIHRADREACEVPADNPSRDVMSVRWDVRKLHAQHPGLQILPTDEDGAERARPISALRTTIELPKRLRNLDLVRSKVLITDDAIVVLDPAALDFAYVMRF